MTTVEHDCVDNLEDGKCVICWNKPPSKVWVAIWQDSGSHQSAIIGIYSDETKAEDGIEDYHMDSKDCYVEEMEVQ